MRKLTGILLAAAMLLSLNGAVAEETLADTPRHETLIVEYPAPSERRGSSTHDAGHQHGHRHPPAALERPVRDRYRQGEQFPALAADFPQSTTILPCTIPIRKGIKWSDGEDLTAGTSATP